MRITNTTAGLIAASLTSVAGSAHAQQIFWAAPVSGNFNDGTKWTGGVVPNIANDATINVTTTTSYTVTHVSGIRQLNRLIVNGDASTTFLIKPGASLQVFDPLNSVFNTGLIVIGEPNAPVQTRAALTFFAQRARINGSGTILLQGYPDDSSARLEGASSFDPFSFVIGNNTTVRGAGQLSAEDWVNNGTIRSDLTNGRMVLFCSPMINDGNVRAINGGIIDIRGTLENTGNGRISCDETSRIELAGSADVTGGEIDIPAGGTAHFRGTNRIEDVWLKGVFVTLPASTPLTLASNLGGLRLDGTLEIQHFDNTVIRRAIVQLLGGGAPFDIGGTGTIRFEVPAAVFPLSTATFGFENQASTEFIRLPGHNLEGNVRLLSSVRVGRTLSPGLAAPERLGIMRFNRTLRMNTDSEVLLDIQGATPNLRDTLEAAATTSALVLDNNATLRLRIGGGYVPADGDIQTIINLAASTVSPAITGTFASVQVDNAPPGVSAELIYTATAVRVRWIVGACDDIDFNNNTVFPEDQDVIDFFNVLAGAECPICNDIDFNNNSVFPEDQDVIDFFNVLAGGACP